MLKIYELRQNNSWGKYKGPLVVFVAGHTAGQASQLAVEFADVYYNGVDLGQDCRCCGDRWCEPWDADGDIKDAQALASSLKWKCENYHRDDRHDGIMFIRLDGKSKTVDHDAMKAIGEELDGYSKKDDPVPERVSELFNFLVSS